MIKETVQKIGGALSGQRAYSTIMDLMRYHRVQASTGYREAARYCHRLLEGMGLQVETLSFPANERTAYWTHHMFKEWDCKGGFLDLTCPYTERLCDFDTNCNSVIARSGPADCRDRDVEIVLMDRGDAPDAYADVDLAGKLVFIDTEPRKFKWAMQQRGAAGVISERMWDMNGFRTRGEMQYARQSTSFSWADEANDRYGCGFVLNANQADRLRLACREMRQAHAQNPEKPPCPTARFAVESSIYDGHIENVVAVLPGQTEEEIVLVAHLCHPKTSANDNSSGVGGAIEAMNTLHRLVENGSLPRPRRGIRLILMPEFAGTYAYLATREDKISRMMAGMNLDMIGGSQRGNGCCTTLTDAPHAAPSFVQDLACLIIDEVKKDATMIDPGDISLYNYQPTGFIPQSDHFIYSDPSVGVPMLMMLQWPDKFYHTSADTLDKLDPEVLGRNATIAAAYAYSLANLSVADVAPVFNKLNARLMQTLARRVELAEQNGAHGDALRDEAAYFGRVYAERARDILRFFAGEERRTVERQVAEEVDFLSGLVDETYGDYLEWRRPPAAPAPGGESPADFARVPKKLFKGPVSPFNFFSQTKGAQREKLYALMEKYGDAFEVCDFATYWTDGHNTIGQIAQNMAWETGVYNPQFVYDYFSYLVELGVMEMH